MRIVTVISYEFINIIHLFLKFLMFLKFVLKINILGKSMVLQIKNICMATYLIK